MKKTIITSVFFALLFTSCNEDDFYMGKGDIVTKELSINEFTAINSMGSFDVNISSGLTQKVEVIGHSNIIDRLEVQVLNDTWNIELKDGNYKDAGLTINIVLPILNKAVLEGSGELTVYDFTSDETVFFGIFGSGDIIFYNNLGCKNLFMEIEGSGNIIANNQFTDVEKLDLKIIGSGSYDGFENNLHNVTVDIKGSGDCNISVNEHIKARIDGSGTINYIGNPSSIESNIKGAGKIVDKN